MHVRGANIWERHELSRLALRSKAHWGYSPEFMAACRDELAVSESRIRAGSTYVGEEEGRILGFYSFDAGSESEVELSHCFVEPGEIGRGCGRLLMAHATAEARRRGYAALIIQSDPNTAGFYERMGARPVGFRPSESIPGRLLPLLQLTLPRMETLDEKIARVVREHVSIVSYDSAWPGMFEAERAHLLACVPPGIIRRIEHFGSTAVPGLCAKPVVDMLIEVGSLAETTQRVVPVLESQGYDYFWRPSAGEDTPPFYAWFIKRDRSGARTHHLHMVEAHFEHWERLLFRDYLIEHPDTARRYGQLKETLSKRHEHDRVAYTEAKSEFIRAVTDEARSFYRERRA
jgi:GrpB-like predicted nucleotidyltransferase (UPF0157 family)/GNAT superfamily N-acetyltransferase